MDDWFSWLILIFGLIGMTYALFAIKNEKKLYIENAIETSFHELLFSIPHWWGTIKKEKDHLTFKRTDTKYEWEASFSLTNKQNLEQVLAEKEIVMDADSRDVHSTNLDNLKDNFEVSRIEGTATQFETERIYYDVFLVKDLGRAKSYLLESKSSILNGSVEGPYFEAVIMGIREKSS